MKIKFFLISVTILLFGNLIAQHQSSNNDLSQTDAKKEFIKLKKELDGVYQVQFVNSRGVVGVTSKMLNFIKDHQDEYQDKTIQYSKNIRLVIRSKQNIANNKLFTEDERVIYIVN